MMYRDHKGKLTFVCDDCGQEHDTDCKDVCRAVETIEAAGWSLSQTVKAVEYCGRCTKEKQRDKASA